MAPTAVYEGRDLAFVGANREWLDGWDENTGGAERPVPGTPYAELFPMKVRDVYRVARVAWETGLECAVLRTDDWVGGAGTLRFIPVPGPDGRPWRLASRWEASTPRTRATPEPPRGPAQPVPA